MKKRLPIEYENKLAGFQKRIEVQGLSNPKHKRELVREFLEFAFKREVYQLSDIKQKTVDEFMQHLTTRPNKKRGGGLSPSYINSIGQAVLRFMEYVKEVGRGGSGIHVRALKVDTDPKWVLTRAEVRQLFEATDDSLLGLRERAMLSLLYGCGLRKIECVQANVEDVSFSKGFIRATNPKNSIQRDVPLSPSVKKYLEEYIYDARPMLLSEESAENGILISVRGGRLTANGVVKSLDRIKENVYDSELRSKQFQCHLLRHSIATHLVDHFRIEQIADFLGHTSLMSLQKYIHLNQNFR